MRRPSEHGSGGLPLAPGMPQPMPCLRSDLTVSQWDTADGTLLVVKDPVSGEFYRLRETEQFIARQFDGATPLDEVRRRTEARFGATLDPAALDAFVAGLDRAGLLTREGEPPPQPPRRGRVRGSLLYLRFKVADPDRLLDHMVRWLRPCFTPSFIALSAGTILFAAWTVLVNWSDVLQGMSRLYRLSTVPAFLVITFLVVSAHEFGHGLTCKRFGGEVHELGLMLMYFHPALYCNVSDAWLFPEKSKRLLVGLAGPYTELFIWALAVLTWRVTAVDTAINYVAAIIMGGSGLRTLFNLSPLLKLDGYYLLSDYLDIPNLRRKSFRYVGSLLQRLWGATDLLPAAEPTPRERRIYLTYGLVAVVPSLAALAIGAVKTSGFLISHHQPLALAAFAGLVSTKVRRRAGRLFGGRGDDEDEADDSEDGAAPPAPAQPANRGRGRRVTMLLVAGLGAAAVCLVPVELRIGGPFTILPLHNTDIRAEIAGVVEQVYVTEGDEVQAGDLIARLSARDRRAELQRIEAQIGQTRARLKLLEAGPTPEEVGVARSAVEKAEDRLRFARARLERNRVLADSAVLTQTELENTEELAAAAENDVAAARHKLEALQRGARQEEVEAARAELAGLEGQRRYLEDQLRRVEVRTPVAGVVATPDPELEELVGQALPQGALIAKVYERRRMTVEIAIPEKEIADVQLGNPVAFKAKALPDRTFYGRVTDIAPTVQTGALGSTGSAASVRTVTVTTLIDNPSLLLKPGMTGQAKVSCGRRRIVDLILRRLARTVKVEFWSWW